jgi:hypothetical protein
VPNLVLKCSRSCTVGALIVFELLLLARDEYEPSALVEAIELEREPVERELQTAAVEVLDSKLGGERFDAAAVVGVEQDSDRLIRLALEALV